MIWESEDTFYANAPPDFAPNAKNPVPTTSQLFEHEPLFCCIARPWLRRSVCLYAAIALPCSIEAGGGGGTSSLVFSAIILWNPIPTPSMTARRMAHPMAPLRTAFAPPRTARAPPVKKPAMMAFQGSSFLLIFESVWV